MPKSTPMDRESADRITRAAENDPESKTAQDGFPERASDAADRNERDEPEDRSADR
jgi:hypothetical protein